MTGMRDLEGKSAIVTGAGRGLGRECATLFASEGARVIVADIDQASGEETVALIRESGGEALFSRTDVSRSEDVQTMVDLAVREFGRLDCAVNNAMAGIEKRKLADIPEEDWDRSIAVNLTSIYLCMKYQIRAMLASGSGSIVNVVSGNEHMGAANLSWYYTAKTGILGMTKSAALEYGRKGVRINALGPGVMETPLMTEALKTPKTREFLLSRCPIGRVGQPREVAEGALWLCSDRSSFVLGHTLVIDGGAVMA